ncbi:MAG: hypothetical protein GXO93_01980 [FCB group bacterium]|nr:hypothetical protein [FCB group bacterium]
MLRRTSTILILSLLLFAFLAMTAFAAKSPVKKRVSVNYINKAMIYSFPNEHNYVVHNGSKTSLGASAYDKTPEAGTVSPGVQVGNTWYDYQQNGTMGRLIGRAHGGTSQYVHFLWMYLGGPSFDARKYGYNAYNISVAGSPGPGSFIGAIGIQPDDHYAGYVALDVTPDDRAVAGGHNQTGDGVYQTQIYFDFGAAFEFFGSGSRVPDSVAGYDQTTDPSQAIWPKIRYQYGTDTVLHAFAQVSEANAADPQAIMYFRKVGTDVTGSWDYPPYVVDTVFDISQDIACEPNGDKVALVWTANLPDPGDCDTCSGTSTIQVQWDNDIYYQISNDQGQTWEPRVNVTKNVNGESGFRPYTDLSALIDQSGNLHILYSAVVWPADPITDGWGYNCRLFHWSENNPYIRTVANADWDQTICTPGAWNINISKMSVSECDGKIYAMWVQYNDIPAGVEDDCAGRAQGGTGDTGGAANGDLWVSVSSDGGLTWDAGRNLTNSYSPDCGPTPGNGTPCDNDNWPSMARYGIANQTGDDWTGATIVDPSGSYTGDYYLDVQYIHDKDAGGIVQNEGTWQNDEVNWFRMACVEPVPNPRMSLSMRKIDFPAWTKPGTQSDTTLTVENIGNAALTYSVATEEDNGPSGWLAYSGVSGSVPSGLGNTEDITISLNNGGVYSGTGIELIGRLIFNTNEPPPNNIDTFPINFFVVDTIVKPKWDTISTQCLSLVAGTNGNFGHEGNGNRGGANMDYKNSGDCDTTADTYLYDGSPLVGWITGAGDTLFNWSIFGKGYIDSTGFMPIGGDAATSACDPAFTVYQSGTFVTHDSTIGLRKIWIAPQDVDSCDFIIQALQVWSYDGQAHNGLTIGEATDWDIPTDSGSENVSGFDAASNLIYQQGVEWDPTVPVDSTPDCSIIDCPFDYHNCTLSDTRFGGMAFIKSYLNGTEHQTVPYSAYTARNDSLVYPNSGFVPSQLYDNMHQSGFVASDASTDLHAVMCYEPNFNLGATDVYTVYTVLTTVQSGTVTDLIDNVAQAKAWFTGHGFPGVIADNDGNGLVDICESCCVGDRGDANGDGSVNANDVLFMINFAFKGGPAPTCMDEADVNGDSSVNANDVLYLINFAFKGGPAPVSCF